DLKERGMKAPAVATGDGALGFWAALAEVYPQTREQRCWVHKTVNVLDRLPKRLQPKAKEMLQEIVRSPDRKSATEEMDHFAREFRAAYPKAVECLRKDRETLLTFYDFPAEHWIHLRTTNPIESSFASVKSRTRQTKGAGSRKAGLAMAYKLILMAQDTWRKITAFHLLPLLRAGVRFEDGKQVQETPEAGKTTTVYLSPPWFEGLTLEEQGVAMSGVAA
ncbi:MAG: transposase, partial [Coprothermobacterota bacterium]|nr:transposase [Coprothermobacterota bacterium]